MKLSLWSIGKAHEPYVREGITEFTKRIGRYYTVDWNILPVPKNAGMLSEADLKKREAAMVLEWLRPEDYLVALDEHGKQLTSEGLTELLQNRGLESTKNMVFLIGGAFGLDTDIIKRANFTWSLSKLTFPHQLVRLILSEQVYRACTILRNEKYHHR